MSKYERLTRTAIDAIHAITMKTETGRVTERGSGLNSVMTPLKSSPLIGSFPPIVYLNRALREGYGSAARVSEIRRLHIAQDHGINDLVRARPLPLRPPMMTSHSMESITRKIG